MGVMVFGNPDVETLALNEETFWSGQPHDNNNAAAREHLQEVRDLVFAGREEEAAQVIDKFFFPGQREADIRSSRCERLPPRTEHW